jgi:chaperonin GroES
MSIKPIRDFMVVSVMKESETTESGLIIKPAMVEEKIVTGTVVSVGSGYLTDSGTIVPLEVKAGDKIKFNKNMSVEVKVSGESVFLLREEHVLGILS